MKKTAIIILSLICINTFAQTETALSFRNTYLNFGLNLSNGIFKTTANQPEVKYQPRLGFRLGLESDFYSINDKLSLETGLSLILSQYKIDELDYQYSSFHIGTHLLTKYELNDFNFGIGPYINFGLFGKQKLPSGNTVNFYSGNDQQSEAPFKRLDFGIDFRLNYSLKWNLIDEVYISYRLGLSNIENIEAPSGIDQSFKLRHFSLGVRSNLSKIL